MKTRNDRIKQAQAEIDAALAKRRLARKLWEESDEELVMAQIKMGDAVNELQKMVN